VLESKKYLADSHRDGDKKENCSERRVRMPVERGEKIRIISNKALYESVFTGRGTRQLAS
jgi:hypothetical protein